MKIVLATKGVNGLFLFKHDGRTEFVVGYLMSSNQHVGDEISSWSSGTYFNRLDDALKYLESRI